MVHLETPFGLSLSKPTLSNVEGPFDKLRANGSNSLMLAE
jgi:hypothetical protein